MPVAGCRRRRLSLHEFLLDIDRRCRWRHRRRITIAVTTISITPITPITSITRPISSGGIPVSVARRIIGGRSCPGAEAIAQRAQAQCKPIASAPATMAMMMAVPVVTVPVVAVTMMTVAPARPG